MRPRHTPVREAGMCLPLWRLENRDMVNRAWAGGQIPCLGLLSLEIFSSLVAVDAARYEHAEAKNERKRECQNLFHNQILLFYLN